MLKRDFGNLMPMQFRTWTVMGATVAACAAGAGLKAAMLTALTRPAPVVRPAEASTRADYLQLARPLYHRAISRALEGAEAADPAGVEAFAQQAALVLLYEDEAVYWPAEMPSPRALRDASAALDLADRENPLVRWLIARNAVHHPTAPVGIAEQARLGRAAMPLLDDPAIPPVLRFRAGLDVSAAYARDGVPRDDHAEAWRSRFRSIVAAFEPGEIEPEEQRYLIRHMVWALRPNTTKQLDPVLKAAENADGLPWAQAMVRARYEDQAGSDVRGGGFAHTVSPDDMRAFREHYANGANFYLEALALRPDWPEPATRLIHNVARAGLEEEFGPMQRWIERANELEHHNRGAYETSLFYFLPRWGGTHEAMLSLAREAVTEAEQWPATHLPLILGDAYRMIAVRDNEGLDYLRKSKDWPLFDRGLTRMAEAARAQAGEGQRSTDWRAAPIVGEHAAWAWAFGDHATAARLLASPAGSSPVAALTFDAVARRLETEPQAARGEALARASAESEAIAFALESQDRGDGPDVLVDLWAGILNRLPDEDPARAWVQRQEADVRFGMDLDAGNWAIVPASPTYWDIASGAWTFSPDDSSISVASSASLPNETAVLELQTELLPRAFTAEITLKPMRPDAGARLRVGATATNESSKAPFAVIEFDAGGTSAGTLTYPENNASLKPMPGAFGEPDGKTELKLRMQFGPQGVLYLSNNVLLSGFRFRPDQRQETNVAILAQFDGPDQSLVVTSVRLQKLPGS